MFGFQNKQDLYLGQFVNLLLQSIIKSKVADSLPNDSSLSDSEIERFKDELFYLRVEILMASLIEVGKFGNTQFSNEEIGKTIGIAMTLALKDNGISKADSEKRLDNLIQRMGIYEDYVNGISEIELKKTGVYFQILQCFSEQVLGNDSKRLLSEKGRDKSFTVFGYAKQIYRNDEKEFKDKIKLVRFLD